MSTGQHIPPTAFETANNDARSAILHLSQKLKDLQAELAIKLAVLVSCNEADSRVQQKHLSTLANEVERALQGIDEVVNRVVSEELSHSDLLQLHQRELEKFCKIVSSNAEKMNETVF